LPALEVEDNILTSSVVIATYLASFKPELLGTTDFEKALVDQWLLFLRGEVQPIARTLAYQVFGQVETDATEHQYIYSLLKDNLKLVNNHLKGKTYLVGKTVTIADIFLTLITLELQ
jgi:elongation factor 1-gamma